MSFSFFLPKMVLFLMCLSLISFLSSVTLSLCRSSQSVDIYLTEQIVSFWSFDKYFPMEMLKNYICLTHSINYISLLSSNEAQDIMLCAHKHQNSWRTSSARYRWQLGCKHPKTVSVFQSLFFRSLDLHPCLCCVLWSIHFSFLPFPRKVHLCGGSLIRENWVLTDQQCFTSW